MSRKNQNYHNAIELARQLNLNVAALRSLYRNSNTEFWSRKVVELKARKTLNDVLQTLPLGAARIQSIILLRNKKYDELFKLIVERGLTLNDNQVETFIQGIRDLEGYYNLKITFRDNTVQIVPVNDLTRDFVTYLLSNGLLIPEVENSFGSDAINEIKINEIVSIVLEKYNPDRTIENKDGRQFEYVNKTKLDLSRYQVFNQEQINSTDRNMELLRDENCLMHTLSLSGVKEEIINNIKLNLVKGAGVTKKDLKKIANIIGQDIVLYWFRRDLIKTNKTTFKCKVQCNSQEIKICLFKNHYFIYEKTDYSNFCVNNYEEVKDEDNFEDIFETRSSSSGSRTFKRSKTKSKMNSLALVKTLFVNNYFTKGDMSNFSLERPSIESAVYLDNTENEQTVCEINQKEAKSAHIFYADCESFVNGGQHELYLLGVVSKKNDFVQIFNTAEAKSNKESVVTRWLNLMTRNGKQNAICYFHNLKYDYHLLEKYLPIQNRVIKDNSFYSVTVIYKKKTVELRDSFKLLPMPLCKITKAMSLDKKYSKKEAIAYKYYTKENNNKEIHRDDYITFLPKDLIPVFKKNVKTVWFNPLSYYKEYLKLDCLVLKKGLEAFSTIIKNETGLNLYASLTISSLTDKFMFKKGAYDNVFKIRANLRDYVNKAVYGGRVHVNTKYVKEVIKGQITDYDGVSLYPSAINRLCRESGLPTGPCKRFTSDDLKNWQDKVYSILTIKITAVNKKQQMPMIAVKSEGSIEYTNEVPKQVLTIDSITLEDYIKFHHIEYTILDGVYWSNKVNKTMGTVIQDLFNARLKAKKDKNVGLSTVLKLMMNSSYGKTILKKSRNTKKIINKERLDNYVCSNFNRIKATRQINDKQVEIEETYIDDSYNRAHIGCAILSMSKRIMNEVFNTANDNGLTIYYTDTDSLHMDFKDVPILESKYMEEYGRELNGKQLEQFHIDFELNNAATDIISTTSIFLGKKSYLDCLESKDNNGNTIYGHHIRLKGITKEGLDHAAKKHGGYLGLYTKLAKGNAIDIILNPFDHENNKEKVLFEFKNGHVKTKKEFIRTVKF